MEVGFALVGFGAWGSHHARAIAMNPGARLIGIADPSPENRQRAAEEFPQVKVVTDYRDLISRKEVDLVDIVVPSHAHEEIAVAAYAAGKHVLLEKPMAVDRGSCDRILAAQKESGKTLNIVHEFRISVQWGAIKKYIDEGRIGEPLYLLINLWRRPYRLGQAGWRWDPRRVGSWILEEPIHFFDLALWYFQSLGDPVSIIAQANSRDRAEGLYDNFSSIIRWKNGAYAVVNHTLAGFEHHHLVELVGAKGSIRSWWAGVMDRTGEPAFGMKFIQRSKGQEEFDTGLPEEVRLEGKSGELFELREMIREALDSVRSGRSFISGENGRKAVLLCNAGEESARLQKEIKLSF